MSWQDTITPIQNSPTPEQKISSWKDSIKPLEDNEEAPGMAESALRGALQGATLGYSDEAEAGVASGLQTLKDAVQSKIPQNESTIEHLVNQYKRYKQQAEDDDTAAEKANPKSYNIAKFAGSFVPAAATFGSSAVTGAPLLGKIAAGAGLGAATEYGNLGQNEEDQLKKTGVGALAGGAGTAIGETVVAPLVKAGASSIEGYLQNQPWAKQLAATVQNKLEGGTLFGEAGPQAIAGQSDRMTGDVADALTGNIKNQTKAMGKAFQQSAEQKFQPNVDQLETLNDFQTAINKRNPGALKEEFESIKSGVADPQSVQNFRQILKNYVSGLYNHAGSTGDPDSYKLAASIKDELFPLLDQVPVQNSTIGGLNTNISNARDPLDAFVQKTGQIIPDASQQAKWSSSVPIEKQNLTVQNTVGNIIDKAGRSTALGNDARNSLGDLQSLLENAKKVSPSLNIDPTQTATDLQQQSYLNAALRGAQGIRDKQLDLNPFNIAQKTFANPYKIAEQSTKIPGVKGIVGSLSERLLSQSPLERQAIAQSLGSNPQTSHLGTQYLQAIGSGDNTKINNIMFQIMQNPTAKMVLGNDEGNK